MAGPVVVHTGGVAPLAKMIRAGWVNGLLAGNALGIHDIESALLGTSLGVWLSDGRQEEHGDRNHMRAINACAALWLYGNPCKVQGRPATAL